MAKELNRIHALSSSFVPLDWNGRADDIFVQGFQSVPVVQRSTSASILRNGPVRSGPIRYIKLVNAGVVVGQLQRAIRIRFQGFKKSSTIDDDAEQAAAC